MKTAAFSAAELRFGAGYPGPRICRTFTRKGAAVSSQGLPEIRSPLGGRPKAGRAAGSFARRSAKADCAARTSSRRSAKADNGGRLCPGGAFSAARPAGTARFLITRGKASFYETATFGRRKVFFCSPFCGLLFCPTRAKLALPAGEKPAAPKPRPPRGGPAQRPRPAPGFCAASANASPGDSAPVRLLEKALWVPPTTEPFRPAPSGKPERKKERRNPGWNAHRRFDYDSARRWLGGSPPQSAGLRRGGLQKADLQTSGLQPWAPSRNAPSVAESPQNQHRRSAS